MAAVKLDPVISTRYDPEKVERACVALGISKYELLRRALAEYLKEIGVETR